MSSRSLHVCETLGHGFVYWLFLASFCENSFKRLRKGRGVRSQLPNRLDISQEQLGFPAKDPRKINQILFFLSELICFYFSKNYKLWLFSMFSGPLGRETKLDDFRADIGQETMALSVLSPDK